MAIKRNTALIYATTWMKLENIMLSVRNQLQKTTCYVFYLNEISRIGKSLETESRLVPASVEAVLGRIGSDC